jgi:hypothetical protein
MEHEIAEEKDKNSEERLLTEIVGPDQIAEIISRSYVSPSSSSSSCFFVFTLLVF